jgi:hypothetical protein
MLSSERLLLLAADACRLSSILLRRVLLQRPATLSAYRERTRQILLDQSRPPSLSSSSSTAAPARPNVAAIKLLLWDRELNLVKYHGPREYARIWWASPDRPWRRRSSGGSSSIGGGSREGGSDGVGGEGEGSGKDVKVARVAFLITSDQRRRLSEDLGYTPEDVRTLRPIEAMLLLEHGVRRDGGRDSSSSGIGHDYRKKLEALMNEERERSTTGGRVQSQPPSWQRQEQTLNRGGGGGGGAEIATTIDGGGGCDEYGDPTTIDILHKHSGGTQRIRAKPDVVTALRSAIAEDDAKRDGTSYRVCITKEKEEEEEEQERGRVPESQAGAIAVDPMTGVAGDEDGMSRGSAADNVRGPSPESKVGGVVAIEREDSDGDRGVMSPVAAVADDDILSLAPPLRPSACADLAFDPSDLLRIKPDVAAAILASRRGQEGKPREGRNGSFARDDANESGGGSEEDGSACWYEVIERSSATATTLSGSIDGRVEDDHVQPTTAGGGGGTSNKEGGGEERIVALFQTRKEALECVQIKRSILRNRSGGESNSLDDLYQVRRRWVI